MTRVTRDPIYRSKVKVTRQLILGQKISLIFGMGRPLNSERGIIIIIIGSVQRSVLVQRFNAVLLYNSLPASDYMD